MRAAFDAVRVNRETGERRKVTRRRLLIALGPLTFSDAAIEHAITYERERRRIAAIVAEIGAMASGTLRAQIRLMERLSDQSREQGTNLYKYADWAVYVMRIELANRPAESGRRPRKNCEALPDPRAAGAAYQAELLELVDRARATAKRPTPIAARLVERPAPGGTPAPSGDLPPAPTSTAPEGTLQSLLAGIRRYHDRSMEQLAFAETADPGGEHIRMEAAADRFWRLSVGKEL